MLGNVNSLSVPAQGCTYLCNAGHVSCSLSHCIQGACWEYYPKHVSLRIPTVCESTVNKGWTSGDFGKKGNYFLCWVLPGRFSLYSQDPFPLCLFPGSCHPTSSTSVASWSFAVSLEFRHWIISCPWILGRLCWNFIPSVIRSEAK